MNIKTAGSPENSLNQFVSGIIFQVLVQAIKEAKEQHPDMSVTKVVVHQETEIAE